MAHFFVECDVGPDAARNAMKPAEDRERIESEKTSRDLRGKAERLRNCGQISAAEANHLV